MAAEILGRRCQGQHVLETVCQSDEQNAYIRSHGQEQFTDIFRMTGQMQIIPDIGDLRGAVDNIGHIMAKPFFKLGKGGDAFFQHPMQETGDNRLPIHLHGGKNRCDLKQMPNIGLAAGVEFAGMPLTGKRIGILKRR